MEICAAMVEYLDFQVGELMNDLDTSGQADNTIVLFFADNAPEGNDPIQNAKQRPALSSSAWYPNNYDTQFASWGRSYSYMAYDAPWAQVPSTPLNAYKKYARANNVVRPNRSLYDGSEQLLPPRPPVDDDRYPCGQDPNDLISE